VTIGGSSAGAITGTTGQFNTSLNVDGAVTADGLTVDGDNSTFNSVNANTVVLQRNGGSDLNVAIHFNQATADTYLGTDSDNSLVVGRALNLGVSRTAKFDQNGDLSLYEDTGTTAKFFWDASAERLGLGTTSPSSKLHLTRTDASGDYAYFGASSDGGARGLQFTSSDSGIFLGAIHTIDATSGSGQLAFATGGTERLRIDSSGNLGIGTSSPATALSFPIGSSTVVGQTASTDHVVGNVGSLGFGITDGGGGASGVFVHNTHDGTFSSQDIRFLTAKGGVSLATERMRIDASGNLLVGTTNSSGTSGSGVKIANPTSPADDGKIMVVGASSTSAQDGYQLYSTGASAYRFFVTYGGAIYATSTSITAISDESLKENIRDLDKGLDTILALKPRRFDWKNGDGNDIMGFVAQEVQEALPELVHDYKYNDSETKLGIKMGDMLPSLVKAIQEQQEIINDLRARVAQLEGV
jgi:hypothetical protein